MAVGIEINGSPITTVRIESIELVEQAENGAVGSGTFRIDDQPGTLVTVGFKDVELTEDLCSDELLFAGFVGPRKFTRGSPKTLAARYIDVTTSDLNDLLQRRAIMAGGDRPAESVGDRIGWLLGSGYMDVVDSGFVVYPDVDMDPNDYKTQRPSDVLADCATRVNFNYFVYPDPDNGPSLWFDDSNTSENYSSDLRFSNVLSDVDWITTFPTSIEEEMTRDPQDVWSRVILGYENGRVNRNRASTAAEFVARDGVGPTSSVKQRPQAIAQADKYLDVHSTERDDFSDTVIVTASAINLLKAGMRAQFRYSHLVPEGYSEFTWLRALETRKKFIISPGGIPEAPDEPLYSIGLRLSPQETGPAAPAIVQCVSTESAADQNVTLPSDVTIGNLLVARLITKNDDEIPDMEDGSWTLMGSGAASNLVGANPRGAVAMYAKIADSTNPNIGREETADQMQMTVCEISGAGLEDMTVFSLTHASSSAWSPGSGSGRLGLYVIAIPRGTDSSGMNYAIHADAQWTVEKDQDIDNGVPCQFAPTDPWWWAAKAENQTDIDLAVSITADRCGSGQFVAEWCAVAMFV